MRFRQGFTLYEMVMVLAITGIIFVFSMPFSKHQKNEVDALQTLNQMKEAFLYARQMALLKNSSITACSSQDGTHCQNQGTYLLVFADHNQNGRLDQNEQLFKKFQILNNFNKMTISSFAPTENKHIWIFAESGMLLNNSTLSLETSRALYRLIIRRSGLAHITIEHT